MQERVRRRTVLSGLAALLGAASLPRHARAASSAKTRLILLGTGGGPRPRAGSSASAQVIIANDAAYVIDCGDGVARQLALAGVPLTSLRSVFITHHHSDHNADYGNLIWLAWASGLRTPWARWGPRPLKRMPPLSLERNRDAGKAPLPDGAPPPLSPLIRAHDITQGG